ncbi:MAG: tRNA guanosine(34) transglycosylase Tgt [bacterium]
MKYLKKYLINGKEVSFPIYFPDATRAVVRSLDAVDLKQAKIEGLVINTYHLMTQPGTSVLKEAGGTKRYMGWDGLIASDSGGFQLLSMIYKNKELGTISDNGVVFYLDSTGGKKKSLFTPEKSIEVQFSLDADIIICLDDCPSAKATVAENKLSVDRTIAWARRCKEEYWRQIEKRKSKKLERPSLLAVIQGGGDPKERERCAKGLLEIGFDSYGFGGWPLDEEGNMNLEILKTTVSFMPENLPKFALGVGNPLAIVEGFKMGYNIFDCVLPTRDARHKRFYVFTEDPEKADILNNQEIHQFLYIVREKYVRDSRPISEFCDCYTCQHHSRAYLHHLFKIEDSLAWRLATIHNLRTYTKLIEVLRKHA